MSRPPADVSAAPGSGSQISGQMWLLTGVIPVVGYALTTGILNVYAGRMFQSHDPGSVAAISFSLTAAVFVGLELGPRLRVTLGRARRHLADVAVLNVTTAIAWLTVLFSLKYIEPAIVNVISLALAPVILAVLGSWVRRGTPVVPGEIVTSVGIFVLIVVLTWGSFTGETAVGSIGTHRAALGVTLAVVAGLAVAASIVYSKRLSEAGFSPRSVMSVRFFVAIAASWVAVAVASHPHVTAAIVPGVNLALISTVVPLYLLQLGIKHAEPITVSLLVCLGPGFTLALQLLDSRLRVSPLSVGATLGIMILVALGVLARHRSTVRAA